LATNIELWGNMNAIHFIISASSGELILNNTNPSSDPFKTRMLQMPIIYSTMSSPTHPSSYTYSNICIIYTLDYLVVSNSTWQHSVFIPIHPCARYHSSYLVPIHRLQHCCTVWTNTEYFYVEDAWSGVSL
jgi:hypothetical protein